VKGAGGGAEGDGGVGGDEGGGETIRPRRGRAASGAPAGTRFGPGISHSRPTIRSSGVALQAQGRGISLPSRVQSPLVDFLGSRFFRATDPWL
jgi:hypothetical protein